MGLFKVISDMYTLDLAGIRSTMYLWKGEEGLAEAVYTEREVVDAETDLGLLGYRITEPLMEFADFFEKYFIGKHREGYRFF